MAIPLLLTAEQARKSLAMFRSEALKANRAHNAPALPAAATTIGEAISRASGLNLPETASSVSDLEVFCNPKLHLDVVATFLANAMTAVEYKPNASYEGSGDAVQEFKGFSEMLSQLSNFGAYMPLAASARRTFTHNNEDCKALLEEIQAFVGESGIDSSIIIRDLIVQASSLTSKEATHTMFVGFHLEGAEGNPILYVFYGVAQMFRTELGKSMATAQQSIDARYYKYQLDSKLVAANAKNLVIPIVPTEKLIKWINWRFLLPTH